ncbi:hypothetical protein [Crinalium epipsammum]|uniref:hypothetical protein n=1 Tax=Crinalium epipsammum TaxID=241425 RepID=UPI000306AC0D|nr:hypothetical protein [Crinalium epipsammum]
MAEATHAVILSGDESKFADWEEFCQKLNLRIIAKIKSNLEAEMDEVNMSSNWKEKAKKIASKEQSQILQLEDWLLLTGKVHRLTRGEDVSSSPMVKALPELMIHLTKY